MFIYLYNHTYSSDFDDEDIEEVKTSARTNSARRKKRRKAKNGIDMTPPDKLLKKAESRSRKFIKHNKVPSITKLHC